jgi:type I restriction enzyme, S subunit
MTSSTEVVPNGWLEVRLADFGTAYSGLSGKSKEDFGSGKPYIPYLNIFTNAVIADDNFDLVRINKAEAQTRVKKGDLLFTISSETAEEVAMCSVYLGNEKELYLNSFCFGFRLNKTDQLDPIFLAQFFRSEFGRRIIFKLAQGATRYNISKTRLLEETFAVPSLDHQRQIAKMSIAIDTLITSTERLIIQKQTRLKWLLNQLLTGRKRLKGFKGKWIPVTIGELFEPVYRYIDWNENEVYNLVSIRRRLGGLFFRGDLPGREIGVKSLKNIHTGDFLISKRQVSHGAWVVVPNQFHAGKVSDEYDCLKIKDRKVLGSSFWSWYCKLPKLVHYAYLDSTGVHIEKLIFDFDLFKKRMVHIPPTIQEQLSIVKIMEVAEAEINLLKDKVKLLKHLKKGVFRKMLKKR